MFKNRYIIVVLVATLMASLLISHLIMSFATQAPSPQTIFVLLITNITLLIALGGLVIRQVFIILKQKRRGFAVSSLENRIIGIFGSLALGPAVIIAVFSAVFLNYGIANWFGKNVQTALSEAHGVATAYLKEHRAALKSDTRIIANTMNQSPSYILYDTLKMSLFLSKMASLHSLDEAVILDKNGRIIANANARWGADLNSFPQHVLDNAQEDHITILDDEKNNRVRAVTKLDFVVDTYLYAARSLDHRVIEHLQHHEQAIDAYTELNQTRQSLELMFGLMFSIFALTLLLGSIWLGMRFTYRLLRPLNWFISAADRVRAGDFNVHIKPVKGEIGLVAEAFNRMVIQLDEQRDHLIISKQQSDRRRLFVEAVLEGVSSGVIGLDEHKNIRVYNPQAIHLLGVDLRTYINQSLESACPHMAPLLNSPHGTRLETTFGQKFLHITITAEKSNQEAHGYVITIDDTTNLRQAERKAAWSDVAKRIAHEIKNPLTPIQLAAERLKRRHNQQNPETPDPTTIQCLETIVRQTDDIKRMINAFASLAKMPKAHMRPISLNNLLKETMFVTKNNFPTSTSKLTLPTKDETVFWDDRLIHQALFNVLKNACQIAKDHNMTGDLNVSATKESDTKAFPNPHICIIIQDRGPGFPSHLINDLTEPYVSEREGGTGLGLAIVKKIIEDHKGLIEFTNRQNTPGAQVTIYLPINHHNQ
jgi:two-component system nitrogen regulation sensor histidine kinase NtrY